MNATVLGLDYRVQQLKARSVVRSITSNLVIALLAGGLFVTSVVPIIALVLIAWLIILALYVARLNGRTNRMRVLLTQVVAFLTVTLVAHLAPTKMQYDHYSERVHLPKADFTVHELEDMAATARPGDFPVNLSITFENCPDTKRIRFASVNISLGDLIDTIERQSPLRHRFLHCGNAYSILWGYPPSYYLAFRDAPRSR